MRCMSLTLHPSLIPSYTSLSKLGGLGGGDHAHDLRAVVRHGPSALAVHQQRRRAAAHVGPLGGCVVDLPEVRGVEDGVFEALGGVEGPTTAGGAFRIIQEPRSEALHLRRKYVFHFFLYVDS